MLGNDVVDLRDPESRPESFRARFDARVFDDCERRAIAHDPNPLARRWAHWGAKEAAYKLVRRLEPSFVFRPKRLVARFEPVSPTSGRRRERCGRVEISAGVGAVGPAVEIRSFETPEFVHVVALPEGGDWGAVETRVAPLEELGADPSEAVRRLARSEIACSLGIEEGRLRIERRERVPIIELDGEPTSLVLSLSHHGRWIAYAMTPRQEAGRIRPSPGWTPVPAKGTGATIWQTT